MNDVTSMCQQIAIASILNIFCHCLVASASYCDRPHSVVAQVQESDYVVYGSVIHIYPQFNIGPDSVLAEMDIKCILKSPDGAVLHRLVNITAGAWACSSQPCYLFLNLHC